MPYVTLPDGVRMHVRMAKPRRRRCCGTEGTSPCPTPATIQCDAPTVGKSGTCDAWCCDAHAREVGPDLHQCPYHASTRASGAQGGLFTGLL